jgi:hypothetical protein
VPFLAHQFSRTLAGVGLALLLAGCVDFSETDFGHHASRGISLGDAMKASAAGSQQPLPERHPRDEGSPSHIEGDASFTLVPAGETGAAEGMGAVSYDDDREYNWQIVADVTHVMPLNGNIRCLNEFTLTPLAFEQEHGFVSLALMGGIADLKPGSLADHGANNCWTAGLGLNTRWYPTSSKPFLSPYLCFGINGRLLAWDYRSPVRVGSETITGDYLTCLDGFVGLGVAIERNNHLSFFGEVALGGTVFLGETGRGFHNDVFDDYGCASFRAGASLKF